jgi:hypothetical protein
MPKTQTTVDFDEIFNFAEKHHGISWNEYHQADNELKPICKDGKLLVDDSLSEIRKRAAI